VNDDGVIDKQEFQTALGLKNSWLTDRIFSVFDENHDNGVNFREFVSSLSILCPLGTLEEKLKCKMD
jgi:Ca2+-binding EF-hand superfamily protein